jgi:hypothetical protein
VGVSSEAKKNCRAKDAKKINGQKPKFLLRRLRAIFSVKILFLRSLAMKQIRDATHEARQIQRFGEEILGVHGHGAPGDVAGERTHEDDRNFFCGRLTA